MRRGGVARGFSLVELLVVVAIMAMLLGLLAPSLAGARESSRGAVCASNARQLQLANDLFAGDHDGRYAPGAARILENRQRWHGARSSASGAFRAEDGPLTAYLAGAGSSEVARACPTFAPALEALAERSLGFETACGGYGYNNAFVGVERMRAAGGTWVIATGKGGAARDEQGARRVLFADPARTVAFADAALAHRGGAGGVIEYSFIEPRWWPEFPGARPDPTVHFRHAGSANVAWLDGHVSAERMSLSWTSGVYHADPASVRIGWFDGDDSNRLFDYD